MTEAKNIARDNPRRPRQSDQDYILHLLKIARRVWGNEFYAECSEIAEDEAKKRRGDAEDACSNITIEIRRRKALMNQQLS